ncbi:MAG TPA: hypothetical protein VGJ83_00950 [Gemmatimonadales bacterium]
MLPSRLAPLAVAFAIIGCTHADVLRLDHVLRPQTRPDSVRLIAQEPTEPYTVIALVSVQSDGTMIHTGDARARLLKEAARLGGHAVLLGNGSLTRIGTGGEYGGTQQQLTGKVIVFDREPAQ